MDIAWLGVHEWVAFRLNNLVVALTVWAAFFATSLLFDATAGALASLVMAGIPIELSWANTAAAEPVSSLAILAAIMAGAYFLRVRSTRSLCWTMALAVFATQFRPESFLVALPLAAIILVGARRECARARFWWAAVAAVLLEAVLIAHMYAVRTEGWGTPGPRLSVAYIADNLRTNGWFYVWDPRFPPIYTVIALTGLVAARSKAVVIPLVYFLTFWGIFLVFYAGSYDYGADVRYSLMTYPPIAMLAGVGARSLISAVSRSSWTLRFRPIMPVVVTMAWLAQFAWDVPRVRAVGEDGWGARADVTFARLVAPWIPSDAVVLAHNPGMFHVWGVNAAQMSLASNPEYVRKTLLPRYPGGVYLHWNFWCNVPDPVQRAFCADALGPSSHRLFAEYTERDYRYAFYRLDPVPGN